MKRPAIATIAVIVIVNALIWGFTMIMCAHRLSGTGAYQQIQNLLAGGSGMSLIVVGGGMAALVNGLGLGGKKKDDDKPTA